MLAKDQSSYREAIVAADNALLCELNEVPRAMMHLTAGRAAAKIGDFEAAERHLKIALNTTDIKELAYTALAEAYFDEKQERRVVALLSDAISEYPKNADYWKKLTIAYARLNDVEQSKRALRRWKQLDPSAPDL